MKQNQEKVIKYQVSPPDSSTKIQRDLRQKKTMTNNKTKQKWYYIVIPIIVIIVGGIIALSILLKKNNKDPPFELPSNMTDEEIIDSTVPKIDNIPPIIPEYFKQKGPLEMQNEYKIPTNVNDLRRIYVNQKYYEDIKIDGVLTKNIIDRKTNYDIYVMEKNEAYGEEKYLYNFTYLCAIAISSECVSSRDEYCIPKKLVDFIDQDQSNLKSSKKVDSLENIPIPLCFMNITDNNVITSISCHKKLNESKINSIVLDLYFFRPPGIKRVDKEKDNITITQINEGNKVIIRETNGGICDIYNPIGSFCSTDMNTTKDSEGNLITYDEFAFTNITKNNDNYYIKKKYTNLVDKTSYISELNQEKFNETINKLYPNLKDFLKSYNQFSLEDFKELYNISKGLSNQTPKRRLSEGKTFNDKKTNFFSYSHYGGVNIQIYLKDNVGYNAEAMEASSLLYIDDNKDDLAQIKEYTNIDNTIKKLIYLSKAGNNLVTYLYNKIKENLNNITEIIDINIPSMNSLLAYKELSDIFDSTFSLSQLKIIPYGIIEESNYLINKLEELYSGIDNGTLKNNIVVLNNYIYQYIQQSHILVNKISNNLRELGKLLKSPKQAISDISNYYMNHTSISYISTIKRARNILMNYYKNEKDLIVPKVKEILGQFENITIDSIEKQIKLINNLNSKLENKEMNIENSNEEDYNKTIINLHNSNNYINNIINLFKIKVEKEMGLKDGYFISQNETISNNDTFTRIIDEALMTAQQLDDNEYVDKLFDEIMSNFRQSFINITKDMELQREEKFLLDENTLNGNYFNDSEQKNISKELKNIALDIIIKVKKENNLYLDSVNKTINEFLENNKEYLNQLIRELDILFSNDKLDEISKSYEMALYRHFNKISDKLKDNKDLIYEYFNGMTNLMTNNDSIIELLLSNYTETKTNYKVLDRLSFCKTNDKKKEEHCINNTYFKDSIKNRKRGNDYINKYEQFKGKLDISKEFIKSDLKSNIKNEYQNIINKLKGILKSFQSNKISDKNPYYTDLFFINNHIKNIDELYDRLNRYISNDIFNNYFIPIIDDFKYNQTNEIENITNFIDNQDLIINVGTPGNENDFCINFERKRTYTCRNGAVYNYEVTEDSCISSLGSNNIEAMNEISFNNDETFEEEFNIFYSPIKDTIDSYNNLINELKKNITSIEMQILDKNITNNYLFLIQNKVDLILSEKFSDNLIIGSYKYYKNILESRLENILNNISNKWINSFDNLRKNIDDNINNFNHSIKEFGVMALLYEAIISQNLTKSFYDSIIKHQKTEVNYTISYYYNFLLQNITSVYQYIINQIPTNQEGLNNITNLRKKQIEDTFNQLFNKVKEFKSNSLSINRQIYALKVSSSNYFNTDSILSNITNKVKTILKSKGNAIYQLNNGKQNDKLSLGARFYLENSLNGLQIEEYYKPINDEDDSFISLDKKLFKKLLSDNWIFDQDDFINQLKNSIYLSTLEIDNDFSVKKEIYSKKLEEGITKFEYSKENISQKISDQYKSHFNQIDKDKKKNIINYISEILNIIKSFLIKEKERLTNYAVSYTSDFSKINTTIQKYKDDLNNKIKNKIFNIVDNFHEKLKEEAYTYLIEPGLNKYLIEAENYISRCNTYETLNSTYNIGEVIYKYVKYFVEEYKDITNMQLKHNREEYIQKFKKEVGLDEIKILIDNELDSEYSELLDVLKKITENINSEDYGFDDYDFNNDIKNDIDSNITKYFENINNELIKIEVGDKIELIGWENLSLCYDRIDLDIFDNISTSFHTFINGKIKYEKNNSNVFIKDIIRKNFNNTINNFIFTFGNEYFERIIKYNENFKIKSLYQNLKYSLVISLNYYKMLYNIIRNEITSLTKDLKLKLYNLNDLDKIAKEKNKIILNMLNDKVDDFIKITMDHILIEYNKYLMGDISIKSNFNENIQKSIKNNLKDIYSVLEKDYSSLLNEQFKTKLINSYSNIMNELTDDMIQTVNELKENIKLFFDDFLSLDIDKVLNQTNYQMNITIDSIEEYNYHFNSFKIPEELIKYLLNYGNDIIKPFYEKIENFINSETKSLTLNNLKNKSIEFESHFKTNEIVKQIDEIYSSLKVNINNILKEINTYGITDFPNKLQNEINRIDKRALRRLNDEQTEEDKIEEYKENIADKSIDENFHKLLKMSKNIINYIQTYEYFDKFIEEIENNKKKLNISYKESQQIINDAYQENDIYQEMDNKLHFLNNKSSNYYNEIKDNFTSLINYTKLSLEEIDNLLNKCANITYKTFEDKYDEIAKEAESIDNPMNIDDKKIPIITHISSHQNFEYKIEVNIKTLIKKARFKFSVILDEEDGVKQPKILAIVNNEIKPEDIQFKISSFFGNCGEEFEIIEPEFNKINYTIILNFDTKTTLVKVTTITDFDKYKYKVGRYKREDSEVNECEQTLGISFCLNACNNPNIETIKPAIYEYKEKFYDETTNLYYN